VVKNGRLGLPREVRVRFWEGGSGRVWGRGRRRWRAGISHPVAWRWMQLAGGVATNGPWPGSGRYLSVAEREEIALGRARGESLRAGRLHTLIPRGTDRWKGLYHQRGAVVHEFGRIKHEWAMLPLRVRRIYRVRLYVDLTILAQLASALLATRTP